jgi:hypothetical protein
MRSRLPSWILLLYVAIDLANPFVPGAFGFTPEKGLVWVEGMIRVHPRPNFGTTESTGPTPAPRRPAADSERQPSTEPAAAPDLTAWLAGVRTGDPPARDLASPESDDH